MQSRLQVPNVHHAPALPQTGFQRQSGNGRFALLQLDGKFNTEALPCSGDVACHSLLLRLRRDSSVMMVCCFSRCLAMFSKAAWTFNMVASCALCLSRMILHWRS